MQHTSVLTFT